MDYLLIILSLSSVLVIIYALFRVISLNKRIPGGVARQTWRLLYYLIGLLMVGYLATLLFPELPDSSKRLIVGIISLAGAVFVLKVINLFYKIIAEIGL
jgi:hypothetical protein